MPNALLSCIEDLARIRVEPVRAQGFWGTVLGHNVTCLFLAVSYGITLSASKV